MLSPWISRIPESSFSEIHILKLITPWTTRAVHLTNPQTNAPFFWLPGPLPDFQVINLPWVQPRCVLTGVWIYHEAESERIDTLKFTTRLESSWPVKWVGGLRSLGTYMQDEDECPVGGDPGTITMVPSQCSTWCFGWVDPAKSERLSWLANFNHLLTLHLMTTLFNDYEPGVALTGIDPWIFLQTVQWVDNLYFVIHIVWVLDWKYLCQNRCQRDYQNPDAVRRSYSIKQIVCSCKIHIQIWRLY